MTNPFTESVFRTVLLVIYSERNDILLEFYLDQIAFKLQLVL